jgi:predicted secreted Zn-dependent protease
MKLAIFILFSISYQFVNAEPEVSVKTDYYYVNGATPNAIRKDMNLKRSGKYDAYTNWHVTWNFDARKNAQRFCEISNVKVKLDIKFIFPQWTPNRSANQKVIERWDDYYSALTEHENHHKEIAETMAQEIEDSLNTLSQEVDCKNLKSIAHDTAHQILNNYKKKQHDYDKETNHGINDGAHFP